MPRFPFERLKHFMEEARAVLEEKRLAAQDQELSRLHRLAHFLVLVVRSFMRNRCPVRAAALAYTTVLALVPILAVGVSITTSLLKEQDRAQTIYRWILNGIASVAPALTQFEVEPEEPQPDSEIEVNPDEDPPAEGSVPPAVPSLTGPGDPPPDAASTNAVASAEDAVSEETALATWQAAQEIHSYIENFRSGALTASAVLALIFVAVTLLSTIEDTFNDMWGVSRGRSWFTRIVQYWAAISLGPVLLVSAATLSIVSRFQEAQEWVERVPMFGWLMLQFVPFVILSVTCCLLYLLMPNTKVNWLAAVIGGTVSGLALQLNNKFSVVYVERVVTYQNIYGILAIVPILMIGLYISWLIVLFGAQVAYGVQNWKAYVQEKQAERINQRGREFIALRLLTYIGQCFHRATTAPSATEMSDRLGIPMRAVCQVLNPLVENRILVEVRGSDTGYFPSRPLARITVLDMLLALRSGTGYEPATADDSARQALRSEIEAVRTAEESVASSITLQALVERLEPARLVERSEPTEAAWAEVDPHAGASRAPL